MFTYNDIDHEMLRQFEYLGLSNLSNQFVFIREESVICYRTVLDRGLELINYSIDTLKTKPVLCIGSNPVYVDQYIDELNQHFDPTDYFVFNADCRPEKSLAPNIAHWPFALILQQMGVSDYSQTFFKKYRISSLSRYARLHRLKLITAIKPFVRDCDVVVGNAFVQNIPLDVAKNTEHMKLFDQLPWANQAEYLDLDQSKNDITYTDISHPAYQSCVNITNESWNQDDLLFMTEKTWKAYAAKCLVINYGSKGIPAELEKLGIQIWKEYDLDLSYPEKINHIINLFQRNDIEEIYKSNTAMVEHNYQLVTSKQFALDIAAPAINKLLNFEPA